MAESGPILALISILPEEFLKLQQINSADDVHRDASRNCLEKNLSAAKGHVRAGCGARRF